MEVSANINSLSDLELISRFKQTGNNNLVGVLYERYTHLVFGVCMKYLENAEDSKDATVEIFVKLLEDLKKHEVSNFKGWLYQVTKNHCLMKLRDKGKYTFEINDHVVPAAQDGLVIQEIIEKDRALDSLSKALGELNKEQQLCVTLFYLEKKSYQQVADITGFSLMQVKSNIQNGKRNLKIIMEKNSNNE